MQALKVMVIVMAVAIVAIIAIIVVTLVQRLGSRDGGQSGFGDVSLPIPDGCTLAGAEAAGSHLILRLDGPAASGCQQAVLLDLESGRVLGRVTATPTP